MATGKVGRPDFNFYLLRFYLFDLCAEAAISSSQLSAYTIVFGVWRRFQLTHVPR